MTPPISTIADERDAALGKVTFGALAEPTWTNRIGAASPLARDHEALGARISEIVHHDVQAARPFAFVRPR